MLQQVAVIYNPFSDESHQLANEAILWLQERGVKTWQGTSREARERPEELQGAELIVAMGGDGTVLRAARAAIPHNIPMVGVALGHLNFMSELSPGTLYDGLTTLLDGGGWQDKRTLIEATLVRQNQTRETFTALNEIIVARGDLGRTIVVEVTLNNIPLTTYRADGVIVATATGSTAYALAAGGPILDPRSTGLVLVPVAAHLTALPSMVLNEDAQITMTLRGRNSAIVAADGHENVTMEPGDMVYAKRCDRMCTFARVQPLDHFYSILIRRLQRG